MSSVEINLWLQDAIEFQLKEHVRRVVTGRIPGEVTADKWFGIRINDIEHSYGFIKVSWSYWMNSHRPTTHQSGSESFTLVEVLRICMTDRKEETE